MDKQRLDRGYDPYDSARPVQLKRAPGKQPKTGGPGASRAHAPALSAARGPARSAVNAPALSANKLAPLSMSKSSPSLQLAQDINAMLGFVPPSSTEDRGPALHSDGTDQLSGQDADQSIGSVAMSGFSGRASEIPHKAEMEESFGRDLSGVKAYTGVQAKMANEQLGANAYAMNGMVAFKKDNPSKELVAHELTHVLQQTEGPAAHGSSIGGIDTSGEAQAESVERAVANGQSASSVLGSGAGASTGGAALKQNRPALKDGGGTAVNGNSSQPGAGAKGGGKGGSRPGSLTGSTSGLQAGVGLREFWAGSLRLPVVSVPGLSVVLSSAIKANFTAAMGNVYSGQGSFVFEASADLTYGLPGGLLELYTQIQGTAEGLAKLYVQQNPVNLGIDIGSAVLGVNTKVGIRSADGLVDLAWQLSNMPIFEISGFKASTKDGLKGSFKVDWTPEAKKFWNDLNATASAANNKVRAGQRWVQQFTSW